MYFSAIPSRLHPALLIPSDPDLSILSVLIEICVLRTRTFHETLAFSAAYQGAAV